MSESTKNIIEYIQARGQATVKELEEHLGISRQALFKHHLSLMIDNDVLIKIGRPPKVFYLLKEHKEKIKSVDVLQEKIANKIEKNYLIITPAGERKEGVAGFSYWCEKQNLPFKKTADEYFITLKKYEKYRHNDLISGLNKIRGTFAKVYLDEIFYIDFYSIERFGKTKLGQLLLYAKQSQNKGLISEVVQVIKSSVDKIISEYKIDGVGFIPPTVKRELQLMKVLEKKLAVDARRVKISKIKTAVSVPQKTLNKIEDRLENARKTIIVEENYNFNNILLIDDAVGSGATLNETAKKIRDRNICQGKIIGVVITGSFKGFDVISEV